MLTIRVLQIGHTDWAESGRFAGRIEIDLTDAGAEQISSIATTLVGAGKVLDPKRLVHVFVSPRLRAKNTFKLLLDPLSRLKEGPSNSFEVTETEDITEWDCGIYEGCTVKEITDLRNEKGLDQGKKWHIWSDGCEGGEYIMP
jgi:probable phosphoglycerate mutase